jgi:hypothetical protein
MENKPAITLRIVAQLLRDIQTIGMLLSLTPRPSLKKRHIEN